MESLPDHVYFKDKQSRFICVNKSLADFFELDHPDDAIGKSDFDFFDTEDAQKKFEAEQKIIRTGQGWTFQEEKDAHGENSNYYVITSKLPLHDASGNICGTFGLSRNITQQKRAEREVQRQRRLLDTIIQILPCRVFLRDREGRFLLVNEEYRQCIGVNPGQNINGERLADVLDDPKVERVLAEDLQVIESGEPIINKLEYDQSIFTENSWVLTSKVPLRSESGEAEGIVGMSLDITEQKRAEELAEKTKEALQTKTQQYEEELLVARQLQEQLMSMGFSNDRLYSINGVDWHFKASYLYNPSHHLGGDFFYLTPIDSEKVGILVCDVMGHGIKASLVTMLIRGLMSEIPNLLNHPSKVLQHLNETLVALAEDEEFPRFVTAVYMTVDLKTGEANLANAGHPTPIIHKRGEGDETYRDCPCNVIGPALGLIDDETFDDTCFSFKDTTEIYFFTDGIIEQETKNGEEFGKQGLIGALQSSTGEKLRLQLDNVKQTLTKKLGTNPTNDDICVVAISMEPTS